MEFYSFLYPFTTGGIEPFLWNIVYQSMVVFTTCYFKYHHAQNPYYSAILNLDFDYK